MNQLSRQLVFLYDSYRTALYNQLYYSERLRRSKSRNMMMEIFLVIANSAAIGGWLIFKQQQGQVVWAVITGLATVIALVKPVINLGAKIDRYSELVSKHSESFYDFDAIVKDVNITHSFSAENTNIFNNTIARRRALVSLDDLSVDKELSERCFNDVNNLIKPESLWMPDTI